MVYDGLYRVVGLHSYLPYLGVVLALHALAAHQLWLLMRASGVGAWLATAGTAVFLVMGAGAEDLVWAWQMGFVGSLAFGLVAVNLTIEGHVDWMTLLAIWLALTASLMCSDIGLGMLAVAGLATLLARGVGAAVAALVVPSAAFLAWYDRFGRAPIGASHTIFDPFRVVRFTWTGLTAAIDQGAGLKYLGGVTVVVLSAWTVYLLRHRRAPAATAAFIGAVLLVGLIAVGRLQLGIAYAATSRYLYLVFALLLPVGLLGLQAVARRGRLLALAVAALLAWGTIHGLRVLVLFENHQQEVTIAERAHVLAAAAKLRAGAVGLPDRPDPVAAPTLTVERLRKYLADGALPDS